MKFSKQLLEIQNSPSNTLSISYLKYKNYKKLIKNKDKNSIETTFFKLLNNELHDLDGLFMKESSNILYNPSKIKYDSNKCKKACDLLKWCRINSTAVRKIVKKLNKNFPNTISYTQQFLNKIFPYFSFISSIELTELISVTHKCCPTNNNNIDSDCPICYEIMVSPRSFVCGHPICKECINKIKKESNLKCPICQISQ